MNESPYQSISLSRPPAQTSFRPTLPSPHISALQYPFTHCKTHTYGNKQPCTEQALFHQQKLSQFCQLKLSLNSTRTLLDLNVLSQSKFYTEHFSCVPRLFQKRHINIYTIARQKYICCPTY